MGYEVSDVDEFKKAREQLAKILVNALAELRSDMKGNVVYLTQSKLARYIIKANARRAGRLTNSEVRLAYRIFTSTAGSLGITKEGKGPYRLTKSDVDELIRHLSKYAG